MKKNLLITGATGYIGSHAVVGFERLGYKTILIDNFSNSSRESLSGIAKILGYLPEFFQWDIQDEPFLRNIFGKYTFDGVIHFAGLKAVWESCDNPLLYYQNNISGSITLFRIMEEYSVKKIILSSSATVYHSDNLGDLDEGMKVWSNSPYGTTKLVLEYILSDMALFQDWSSCILRYFNPIGADPSGYIGEIPNGIPNNLLPYIFDVALGKREYISIYGDDYKTKDGTGVRDYIDVCDLIGSHILAYQNMTPWSQIINIGTGDGKSVLEMIALVEKVSGKHIPYIITPRRTGDLDRLCCNPDKAYTKLWWKATTTTEKSISNSWHHILKNHIPHTFTQAL